MLQRVVILSLVGLQLTATVGCASSGMSQTVQNSQAAAQIQIAVSPSVVTLSPATQQKFTATVQGTSNSAVTWSASNGSISSDGIFTAPAVSSGMQVTVTAKSVASSAQATGMVTVQPAATLAISTTALSGALANTPFNAGLGASGGAPPYRWSLSSGSLPPGITLQTSTGAITGSTSHQGEFNFTAKVTDSASNSSTQNLSLTVSPAISNGFDGPAELPRVYLTTTLADTPAPGAVINVSAGGDLQSALNSASCGETIQIQAGATFSGGQITFPAKSCDDQHWIIVRTSAPNSSLPAEGSRINPCYAGVASLPGRPSFSCPSTKKVLPTISYTGTGEGPILFANGANHYRLLGLEITRSASSGLAVGALITPADGGIISQIVLDRLYIHGSPSEETRRGVELSRSTSVAVQDSYISELHCKVNGSCTDSQAVGGGSATVPMGPWKIDDNFLEAAGENILFGGDASTQTPADIEIRFNHLFKPMFWLQGQPGFVSPAFVVKNHFEVKNAQRILFDSNILEDTWGGFTQHGFSILLTAKNQDSLGANVCPLCQVTDVTIRYSTISHVGGGLEMGNSLSDSGGAALAGERFSVHDLIIDDIDDVKYLGHGAFAQIGTIAQPLLSAVEINHVTAFPNHTMIIVGAPTTSPIPGFIFTNSIVGAGQWGIRSTGGGPSNCAFYDIPIKTVDLCFITPIFSPNAILGTSIASSSWPGGNLFYTTSSIGFVNYNNGSGGDYHLTPSSPAAHAASDGTSLGANVDAVLSAINGVR